LCHEFHEFINVLQVQDDSVAGLALPTSFPLEKKKRYGIPRNYILFGRNSTVFLICDKKLSYAKIEAKNHFFYLTTRMPKIKMRKTAKNRKTPFLF